MNKFILLISMATFSYINNIPIQLKSPNEGTKICFDVVTLVERQRLLKEETVSIFKIHKNPFYEMPIHLLRNGF